MEPMPMDKNINPATVNSQVTSPVRMNFAMAEDNSRNAAMNQNMIADLVCHPGPFRDDSITSSFDEVFAPSSYASFNVEMIAIEGDPSAARVRISTPDSRARQSPWPPSLH